MELTSEQKVIHAVINEAWGNDVFKKELIADPESAIEKFTGQRVQMPKGKTLVIRDQTDENTIYINIPAEKKLENIELNEEQLELVAGGALLFNLIHASPDLPTFVAMAPNKNG